MKRIAMVLGVLLLVGSAAAAATQDLYDAPALRKLGLGEEEIRRVQAIWAESQKAVRGAQAEIQVAKAQLSRLLLDVDADMAEVEKLLRAGLEGELAVRKAQILREQAIRKLVGDERWGKVVKPRIEEIRRRQAQRPLPLRERLRELLRGLAQGRRR